MTGIFSKEIDSLYISYQAENVIAHNKKRRQAVTEDKCYQTDKKLIYDN